MTTTAAALIDTLTSANVPDSNMEPANVVDVIAGAGHNISRALRALGTNDAATNMGGLELLAKEVQEGCQAIADGLNAIADAIKDRE